MNEIVDKKTVIIIVVTVIAFTLGIIFIGSTMSNADAIEEMSCTELWDSITEHVEEIGLLPPKAHAQWLVKECWS